MCAVLTRRRADCAGSWFHLPWLIARNVSTFPQRLSGSEFVHAACAVLYRDGPPLAITLYPRYTAPGQFGEMERVDLGAVEKILLFVCNLNLKKLKLFELQANTFWNVKIIINYLIIINYFALLAAVWRTNADRHISSPTSGSSTVRNEPWLWEKYQQKQQKMPCTLFHSFVHSYVHLFICSFIFYIYIYFYFLKLYVFQNSLCWFQSILIYLHILLTFLYNF